MNDLTEQRILQQCGFFQSYLVEQMIRFWVFTDPNPEQLINDLVAGWRERATDLFKAQQELSFRQTGIINTEGDYFQIVLDHAEHRVRTRLLGQTPKTAEDETEPLGRTM
jgi:hypothetical protein